MSFIVKLIGFILGYRYGGFLGAIFGVFVGHWLDKKIYNLGSVRSSFFDKNLTRQDLFMQTTFAVLGHLSKAKGRVTEQDIELARSLMQQLNLDDAKRRLAQEAFSRGKDPQLPLHQLIREFRVGCGRRADLLRMFLHVQLQAALLDNQLDQAEKEILWVVADGLGLSRFQFEQMLAMEMAARHFKNGGFNQHYQYRQEHYQQQGGYQHSHYSNEPTLDDAFNVLGVSADADRTAVKKAYRRLMNENHPDKLVAKGLPPEMLEMAKEKAQQIQAAYDLICKAKGWK